MRAFCSSFLALWTALLPPAAAAQWPGAVEGRALDALTREGVEAASVRIPGRDRLALSDASGRFRFRAVEPGVHELTIERVGYVPLHTIVEVANGRTATLVVELVPIATPLAPIDVEAESAPTGAVRVKRGDPGTLGARTAGDLLVGLPGVSVTSRGPGAAETVSIRGSSADAVLVFVDGVPLNDPVSGEADLSLVSADAVRDVTLLSGARNARYGPRAEAGVILIRTGGAPAGPRFEGSVGSLRRTSGVGSWVGKAGGVALELGVTGETLGGRFAYEQDASVGGREGIRENAGLSRWGARAGLDGDVGVGQGRLRVGFERMDRGLPGRSFAPSPLAHQNERRWDVSGSWGGPLGVVDAELDAFGSERRTEVRDSNPPSGSPYDDRTRFHQLGTRGLLLLVSPPAPLADVGLGWEVSHQRADSDALTKDAPSTRTDAGAFITAGFRLPAVGPHIGMNATVRLDRVGIGRGLTWSHELEMSAIVGPVTARVAHRSAFSPPTLADQFFRAGVGVAPNPDLRPERVPSELEAGVDVSLDASPFQIDGSISSWVGDVRDMIVWAPDFRFVWSPRNVDVLRRGFDARVAAIVHVGEGTVQVSGSWTLARVTYDREGDRDLQLRYRPRHQGGFGLRWEDGRSAVSFDGRYLGSRLPVVSDVNRLPGFWSLGVTATTGFRIGGWGMEPRVRVDRLLDARDSMIFAFPEPGRTVSIGVAVHRFPNPPPRR